MFLNKYPKIITKYSSLSFQLCIQAVWSKVFEGWSVEVPQIAVKTDQTVGIHMLSSDFAGYTCPKMLKAPYPLKIDILLSKTGLINWYIVLIQS